MRPREGTQNRHVLGFPCPSPFGLRRSVTSKLRTAKFAAVVLGGDRGGFRFRASRAQHRELMLLEEQMHIRAEDWAVAVADAPNVYEGRGLSARGDIYDG